MNRVRGRVVILAFAAFGLEALALSGCAPSTPTADPTVVITDDPSASAAPSEAATDEPASEGDPTDPSTWLIDFGNVGPIALGTPVANVTMPSPYVDGSDPNNCPGIATFGAPTHPSFLFVPLTSGVNVDEIVLVSAPDVQLQSSPKTAKGIGIGSTPDAVTAAYPDAVVTPGLPGNTNYTVSSAGINITMLVEGTGNVRTIVVGGGNHADYPICAGD